MGGERTMLVAGALAGNLAAAGVRAAAYLATGSSALAALAVHAIADALAQALLLRGLARPTGAADDPTDAVAQSWFWTTVVPIFPLALGAGVALSDGLAAMLRPALIERPEVAYGALVAGLVLHGVLLQASRATGDARPADAPARAAVAVQSLAQLAGGVAALIAVAMAAEDGARMHLDGAGAIAVALAMSAAAARHALAARRRMTAVPAGAAEPSAGASLVTTAAHTVPDRPSPPPRKDKRPLPRGGR